MNVGLFVFGFLGLCLVLIPAIILVVLIVSLRVNYNGLSMLSLISGILGFCFLPLAGSVAAVVSGNMALNYYHANPEPGNNHNLAQVGVILGWAGIGLGIIALLGFIFLFAFNLPANVHFGF